MWWHDDNPNQNVLASILAIAILTLIEIGIGIGIGWILFA